MPIAVMIESSEKTRSIATSWTTVQANAGAVAAASGALSRASTSPWMS